MKNNIKTIFIIEPDDLTKDNNGLLLDHFFEIHKQCFPVDAEREEREEIEGRIREGSSAPHTHLVVGVLENQVVAGAVIEFYPKSGCILLTYIFTDPAQRGAGLGKFLLQDKKNGIPKLLELIKDRHSKLSGRDVVINAFFFETEDPSHEQTPIDANPMHFSARLEVFYNLGAKRINVPYVQPPVGEGKEFSRNLYLCVFPEVTGAGFLFSTKTFFSFLAEFYYSLRMFHPLGSGHAAFDHDLRIVEGEGLVLKDFQFEVPQLKAMRDDIFQEKDQSFGEYLDGYLYLHELPRAERPKIKFQRAAVAFELVVDESYFTILDDAEKKAGEFSKALNQPYCVVTHSFETDLFSYTHQSKPPYFTRCFMPSDPKSYLQDVTLRFPNVYEFVSEGRREIIYHLNEDGSATFNGYHEIGVNVFLNFSWFHRSKIRVWHIVLASKEDEGFSELDIIKLMKFFSGAQESQSEASKVKQANRLLFKVGAEEWQLYDFFEKLSGVRYSLRDETASASHVEFDEKDGRKVPGLKNLRTGVVQIDTDYCAYVGKEKILVEHEEFQKTLRSLYARLCESEAGDKVMGSDIEHEYKKDPAAEYVFKAYCGITLGIFDYERMGFEEVGDTLLPRSATTTSFLTVNRGVLTSFGHGDSVLDSAWGSIGINPYLLIPGAVLAQNEFISIDAKNKLDILLDKFKEVPERNAMMKATRGEITVNITQLKKQGAKCKTC